MKSSKKLWIASIFFLLLFVALTGALTTVDVGPAGDFDTPVGLSGINSAVYELLPFNLDVFYLTELLGNAVLLVVPCFALVGLFQLISRRSFKKVDGALYLLVLFYVVVLGIYVAFDKFVVINNRPTLENVPSFPSSHTLMAVTFVGTAVFLIRRALKGGVLKGLVTLLGTLVIIAITVGRLMSGVHWLTDVLASVLLGLSLNLAYMALVGKVKGYKKSSPSGKVFYLKKN